MSLRGPPGARFGPPRGYVRPPGAHLGTSGGQLGPPGAHVGPLGVLLGVPGALLGASGEAPRPSQIAPGGSPGGPPHRSLILAPFWGSCWLHFGTPRSSKNMVFVWKVLHFSKNRRGTEKHPKNGNLAIMEREAREVRERTSIASKARAARAAKTARGRAAGSPRGAKARVARAAPDSRQQAHTIPYSLARALRALAGGLSWERLGRIALL